MDFALTESQQVLRDLVEDLLATRVTAESLRASEASTSPGFDRGLWAQLASAGVLGVNVREAHGGLGFGFLEASIVLAQAGRHAAPAPLASTLATVATVGAFGTPAQQAELLPAVTAGDLVLSAALAEPQGDPLEPTVQARATADGWALTGVRTCVPAGLAAGRILVPARTDDGAVLVLVVDPAGPGVIRQAQETITYAHEALVELDGAPVGAAAVLGSADDGAAVLRHAVEHHTAAMCSVVAGAMEGALALTAAYVQQRHQFGQPLAAFQAVRQRAADAYIDAQTVGAAALAAAWALDDAGSAPMDVAVAKFVAAEAGQRVVRAAHHLHGGTGVDRDYPLHRYSLLVKQLELSLGGSAHQLGALGRLLADDAVAVL